MNSRSASFFAAWRKVLHLALCSSGLALGAIGTTTPPVITPIQPVVFCAPPSGESCNSVWWIANCGTKFGSMSPTDFVNNPCLVGQPNLQDAWRADWVQKHPQWALTDKVFKAAIDDFVPAVAPSMAAADAGSSVFAGTVTSWASHEEQARMLARQAANPDPLTYRRPGAPSFGSAMNTCEDYVYRSFDDVERWIDGINACKDAARCKVNVSLNGMTASGSVLPGIARHAFKDSDAVLLTGVGSSRINTMFSKGQITQMEADPFDQAYRLGSVPKNSFYAGTSQIFSPALVDAFTDAGMGVQISGLVDETARGENLYAIGFQAQGNGAWSQDSMGIHQNFVDEWEFHDVLNQRTASVTEGEIREYRKRNAQIVEALEEGTDRMKCLFANKMVVGGCNGMQINAVGKTHPGDKQMWESDPFAARSILASISPYSFTWPPSMNNQVGFGTELQLSNVSAFDIANGLVSSGVQQLSPIAHLPGMTQGLLSPHLVPVPPGVPAPPNTAVLSSGPPPMILSAWVPHVDPAAHMEMGTLKWMINRTWTVNPPRIDRGSRTPKLDCRYSSPRVVLTRGSPMMLVADPDFHTETVWPQVCEMTNVLLVEWARKLNNKPSCLERTSSRCDWSPQDFVDRFVTKNMGYGAAAKEVEYQYCKRWTGGGKLTDQTRDLNNKLVKGLEYWDRFYLANVRAAIEAREAEFKALLATIPMTSTNNFGTQKIDSAHIGDKIFGGGYGYDLSWHASPVGRDGTGQICRMGGSAVAKFNADAILFTAKFKIVDALASVTANENDDHKAEAQAHLYVVGYEFFDTGPDPINLIGNVSPDLPGDMSDKQRVQLLKLPFQVGPVTVTITAGIAFDYGSTLTIATSVPVAGSCDVKQPVFQVKSVFKPYADLGVWADADASLAGIVGVGLEVELTLVGLALPLTAEVHIGLNPNKANELSLMFNAGLDLELTTMAGQINFYIEALFMQVASFKIVSWPGFRQKFPIFRTPPVALPLSVLSQDIKAPEPT